MALFVLKEGYRVETTPTGGRVVHVRTGDSLELNCNEIQLLARAAAGGLEVGTATLKPIVRKLSGLGLLECIGGEPDEGPQLEPLPPEGADVKPGLWVFAPPDSGAPGGEAEAPGAELSPSSDDVSAVGAAAEPASEEPQLDFAAPAEPAEEPERPEPTGLQSPELLVPVFRSDLKLERKGKGGVYDVSDPKTGKTFAFYDFEISIARMLNGQRRFGEVVKAANGLGIPVSIESLSQFIRQLERYGFLAPDGTDVKNPPPGSIWGKRAKWTDSIRFLYQSGLRLMRQGRYYEAAAYFEAILEHDPDNGDAREMLDQVKTQLANAPQEPTPEAHPEELGMAFQSPEEPAELEIQVEKASDLEPAALEAKAEAESASLTAVQPEPPAPEELPAGSEVNPAALEAQAEAEIASLTAAQPPAPEELPAMAAAGAELDPAALEAQAEAEIASLTAAAPEAPASEVLPAAPAGQLDPAALEAQAEAEIASLTAAEAEPSKQPEDWSDFAGSAEAVPAAEVPAEQPVFDPYAETAAVQPLGINAAPEEAPLQQTFDPFSAASPVATPDLFAAPIKTRVPTQNPFARPERATEAPHRTPDPFAAAPAASGASSPKPSAVPIPAEFEKPLDPFVGPDALDLSAEPELPASALAVGHAPAPESPARPAAAAPEPLTFAPPAAPATSSAPSLAELVEQATKDVEIVAPEPLPALAPPVEPAPSQMPLSLAEIVDEATKGVAAAPAAPEQPVEVLPSIVVEEHEAPPPPPPAVELPKPPPAPSPAPAKAAASRMPLFAAGLGALAVAGAGVWFFGLRTPAVPQTPPKPVVAVQAAGRDASAALPDAAARAAGPDAAAVAGAGLDAAVAGLDAAAPGLDAAALAGPDAATEKPASGGQEGWTTLDIAKRGRVNMGDLKAPVAGTITWAVSPQERVRKAQLIGKITDADGNDVALMSPNVGLLATKVADQESVKAGMLLASVPYFEAYGQTTHPGPDAPTPDWACEIFEEGGESAPCKVNKAEPRKGAFFVTFTAEPLWFDASAKVKVRLRGR